jgi:hypothetical protein
MISRRGFVGVSSAAVAGAACGVPAADSQTTSGQGQESLPPSIAALQSQRSRATPITTEERRS